MVISPSLTTAIEYRLRYLYPILITAWQKMCSIISSYGMWHLKEFVHKCARIHKIQAYQYTLSIDHKRSKMYSLWLNMSTISSTNLTTCKSSSWSWCITCVSFLHPLHPFSSFYLPHHLNFDQGIIIIHSKLTSEVYSDGNSNSQMRQHIQNASAL